MKQVLLPGKTSSPQTIASCFDALGPLICFSTVAHLIPPTACLSFDVSVRPTELPRSHQRGVLHGGRKQEFLARESHFRTSHSLSVACSFCLSPLTPCTRRARSGKEKETGAGPRQRPGPSGSAPPLPDSQQPRAALCQPAGGP